MTVEALLGFRRMCADDVAEPIDNLIRRSEKLIFESAKRF